MQGLFDTGNLAASSPCTGWRELGTCHYPPSGRLSFQPEAAPVKFARGFRARTPDREILDGNFYFRPAKDHQGHGQQTASW
jgi:hypothetical protein